MRLFRHLGISGLVLSLIFLAGCQNARQEPTQAAGVDNSNTSASEANAAHTQTVTIPAGTEILVRLADTVGSAENRNGDRFLATLDHPIIVDNWVAVPKGAKIMGKVTAARPSGHLRTPAELALTLTSIDVNGNEYDLTTSTYVRRARSHAKRNAAWIGGAAAGGALLGGLIGGGKGAAIGAGAGAGGGTATAYATGKKEIVLPSETRLAFRIKQPLIITVTG